MTDADQRAGHVAAAVQGGTFHTQSDRIELSASGGPTSGTAAPAIPEPRIARYALVVRARLVGDQYVADLDAVADGHGEWI